MKQEELSSDLTVIGLILILLFIMYELIVVNNKMTEAMKVAILLDSRLTQVEIENKEYDKEIEVYRDMVNSLNRELDSYDRLETLHKDLLRIDK